MIPSSLWISGSLIFIDLLAGLAVGVGIIFEGGEHSTPREKVGAKLVIWGVVFEALAGVALFGFDTSESLKQQAQIVSEAHTIDNQAGKLREAAKDAGAAKRDAAVAITNAQQAERDLKLLSDREERLRSTLTADEKAAADRHLTKEQTRKIAAAARAYAGTPFNLSMLTQGEPMRLTDQIEDAILAGNWKEISADPRGGIFNRGGGRPPTGERSMVGVWVCSAPEYAGPRHALALALRAAHIATKELNFVGSDPEDHRGVAVWVGGKS